MLASRVLRNTVARCLVVVPAPSAPPVRTGTGQLTNNHRSIGQADVKITTHCFTQGKDATQVDQPLTSVPNLAHVRRVAGTSPSKSY